MIGPDRFSRVTAGAVVPEQVVAYATAAGDGAPRMFGSCIAYVNNGHAVLIGYPVHDPLDCSAMAEAVTLAGASPDVRMLTVLGPARPPQAPAGAACVEDAYYGVDLPIGPPRPKLANLLRRAQRDLKIDSARALAADHDSLVGQYLDNRELAAGTRVIYSRLGRYLAASAGSVLFSARLDDGRLAAFAVGEFASFSTAFFMFCFRDSHCAPPGAADLVLSALVDEAARRGQQRVNLGLGIHSGIQFFKKKWKARAVLPCVEVSWQQGGVGG
jgi:hypothetical protein